jgi:hypothetical protein
MPSFAVMAWTSAISFAAARFRLSEVVMKGFPLWREWYGLGLLGGKG